MIMFSILSVYYWGHAAGFWCGRGRPHQIYWGRRGRHTCSHQTWHRRQEVGWRLKPKRQQQWLKGGEQQKTNKPGGKIKHWRDNIKAGTVERDYKSLNLALSHSLSLWLCLFCAGFGLKSVCRSPRKLPLSIQPYKHPHAPRVPVKTVTPIKAHSLVMNWEREPDD